MTMRVNKARSTGVQITDPLSRVTRVQFNHDAVAAVDAIPAQGEDPAVPAVPAVPSTATVVVEFFESQAVIDANGSPFDTRSYQVDEPTGIQALIDAELKSLTDFDAAV